MSIRGASSFLWHQEPTPPRERLHNCRHMLCPRLRVQAVAEVVAAEVLLRGQKNLEPLLLPHQPPAEASADNYEGCFLTACEIGAHSGTNDSEQHHDHAKKKRLHRLRIPIWNEDHIGD